MWKTIVASSTAAIVAGSAIAYAQQDPKPQEPKAESRSEQRAPRPSAEDMRAFAEARLAALRAGLMLNPEQEKHWAAYEQTARNFAKVRVDRREALRSQQPPADRLEALRRHADAMVARATALKQMVDAVDPLYRSLDEAQKRRFAALAGPPVRQLGLGQAERGRHWHRNHEERRPQWRRGEGWDGERSGNRRWDRDAAPGGETRSWRGREGRDDRFERRSESRRNDGPDRFDDGRRERDRDDRRDHRGPGEDDRQPSRL